MNKQQKGFTLIELLVVILIVSILAGLLMKTLSVQGTQGKARDAQRKSDIKYLQSALEQYYLDHRVYPKTAGVWVALDGTDDIQKTLDTGGYIPNVVTDPRSSGTSPSTPCSTSDSYHYYYQSNDSGSMYYLVAVMEIESSATENPCADLSVCSSSTRPAGCYAVKNP